MLKKKLSLKNASFNTSAITYRITPIDPPAHRYHVCVNIPEPLSTGQLLELPAWIPGSYLIRDFAQQIVEISASCKGKEVPLVKQSKHSWLAAPCAGPLQVEYQVYAWDISIRGAYLDEQRGFFNGSSVFLSIKDQTQKTCLVEICRPQGARYQDWRIATALREHHAQRYDFGTYEATDYDELIDHPVEMGRFVLAKFNASGTVHDIAITGTIPNLDLPRLTLDLEKICTQQIKLFEPHRHKAPINRYVFLLHAIDDGYGGLEHRASSALLCSRAHLPIKGNSTINRAGYRQLLGLFSHEYFHTWHIKRIKPAVFVPYDLQRENYTRLLWLFEGFTSYYDNLMLLRSGVIDLPEYLSLLSENITEVMRSPGRFKQTLSESSFDAWIKYYRPNENSPNATVSYYSKGALLALALDLTIRHASHQRRSLDDIMRILWQKFGRDFYHGHPHGIAEDQVIALFNEATGLQLDAWLERALESTHDLPLAELLQKTGFTLKPIRSTSPPGLGVRLREDSHTVRLGCVYEDSPAQRAGLSAGDILIAMDGLRIKPNQMNTLLNRYQVGDKVELHVFRRDELCVFQLQLGEPELERYAITSTSSGKRHVIGVWPAAINASLAKPK